MKNAVFMGLDERVHYVYPDSRIELLNSELNFPTLHVITKEELGEYRDILKNTDYIFSTWGMPHFEKEEIKEYLPNLKAIFYAAGTVQGFAREFLDEGVAVFSAWAANGVPVAEYTLAQIILASKGFFQTIHRKAVGSNWNRNYPIQFPGNYGIKVGIIGAGMIGKMVIEKLKSLEEIETLVFDPFLSDEKAAELGVTKVDLKTIFAECQVVSNHLANNSQTVGMINKEHFDLMKPGCVFINTGRGAQVVEDDMIAALEKDPTLTAVLDVTFPEPPVADSKLYTLDNVFLTPHIAGSLGNEVHRMSKYMYEEYKAFDAGLPTKYSVSLDMLKTMA